MSSPRKTTSTFRLNSIHRSPCSKGDLTWERAKQPDDGRAPTDKDFRDFAGAGKRRIELVGPNIAYLNLKASPINIRGIYRPVLTPDGKPDQPIIGPAFAVQQFAP